MILGAVIVTVAVLSFYQNDNPFSQTPATKQAAGTPATAQQPAANSAPATPDPTQPATVTALPGKPGDRPVEKSAYTFYSALPSGENAPVAQTASTAQQPQAATPPAQAAPMKQRYLQLAAFENAEQADDLKARLLLMGLDPVTQRAQLSDGRVVHRIRIGPFTDPDDLRAMRGRLVSNGFSAEEVSN
jgi:cell division protein FtsN